MTELTQAQLQELHGEYNIPKKMANDLKKLDVDAVVELWELDRTAFGLGVMRFCNQENEKGESVVFAGETYLRYPIEGNGFKLSAEGSPDRPTVKVANIEGIVTAAIEPEDTVTGAIVNRKLVLAKYLDAVNFADGNPEADPMQVVKQTFVVERITALSSLYASFELVIPSDTTNTYLPNRMIISDVCVWVYRGEGCHYSGRTYYDINDKKVNEAGKDVCSKSLKGCRLRFGSDPHGLPFGGFPSVDKIG